MRTHISNRLRIIAHFVGKCKIIKRILWPAYKRYLNAINQNRLHCMRYNGERILGEFDKALTSNGIPYYVMFGTLLGAIREKGFIKHDFDIDTCIWEKDYNGKIRSVLESNGFKRVRHFLVENGTLGREETYTKEGVDIDIFYIFNDVNNGPYTCDFTSYTPDIDLHQSMNLYGKVASRRLYLPFTYTFERAPFENIEVNIPNNSHNLLETRYGTNYMIPDPSFRFTDENPNIVKMENLSAIFVQH